MDTIENNAEPVGEAGATASPDTSAQVDTQTVSPAESVSDGTEGQGTGEAPLLAGKYKSQEELVKAYTELEGKLGSLGQKAAVADLLQETYGVSPEQLRAQIEQQEMEKKREYYAQNPLAPVLDEVQELRAWKNQQEQKEAQASVKAEIDSFIKSNPGYESHKDKLMKLALTPGIGFDPKTGVETDLSEIASDYFGTARAQGQQDAYKKIDTKISTQATGVSKAPPKGKPTLEELRNMTYEERLAVLPHGPTS